MKLLKLILPSLMLMLATVAQAQNLTVTGVVTDSSTGEPVPFASIRIDGTMTGGMTDIDGAYSIAVPSDGVLILLILGNLFTIS